MNADKTIDPRGGILDLSPDQPNMLPAVIIAHVLRANLIPGAADLDPETCTLADLIHFCRGSDAFELVGETGHVFRFIQPPAHPQGTLASERGFLPPWEGLMSNQRHPDTWCVHINDDCNTNQPCPSDCEHLPGNTARDGHPATVQRPELVGKLKCCPGCGRIATAVDQCSGVCMQCGTSFHWKTVKRTEGNETEIEATPIGTPDLTVTITEEHAVALVEQWYTRWPKVKEWISTHRAGEQWDNFTAGLAALAAEDSDGLASALMGKHIHGSTANEDTALALVRELADRWPAVRHWCQHNQAIALSQFCQDARDAGRNSCGACALCCQEQRERADVAELRMRGLRNDLEDATTRMQAAEALLEQQIADNPPGTHDH